jgi:hypothetical protein
MRLKFEFCLRARFAMLQLIFKQSMRGIISVALSHYPRRVWKWSGWTDKHDGPYSFFRVGWLQISIWRCAEGERSR